MFIKRLRITRFDALVWTTAALLVMLIGISAVVGRPPQGERVAFLKREDSGVYNIWIADPAISDSAQQLTFEPEGVFDLDSSPDGRWIVYARRTSPSNISEIILYDLRTRQSRPLTNCVMQDSDCTAPRFRPTDGKLIAYERLSLNRSLGLAPGLSRIWLLDLATDPPSTYPLFEQDDLTGYGARWSADGDRLAFYENAGGGIMVYDFTPLPDQPQVLFIPSDFGVVGSLSPDGGYLAYPEMVFDELQFRRANLQVANLETGYVSSLTEPGEFADDQLAEWHPNGEWIAISRQYMDERYTRGTQIYLKDTTTGALDPLVVEPAYSSSFFRWNRGGTALVMQRFRQLNDQGEIYSGGSTEIWVYDMETRRLIFIADNAYNPIWIP